MYFDLDDSQKLLAASARQFLQRAAPPRLVREIATSSPGYAKGLWQHMVDLGWPGLLMPDAAGGSGLGPVEAALLAQEMGRALAPAPVAGSWLLGMATRTARWEPLEQVAAGNQSVTFAWAPADSGWAPRPEARFDQDGLHGEFAFVPFGAEVDWVCCLTTVSAGAVGLVVVPSEALEITPTRSIDFASSYATVRARAAQGAVLETAANVWDLDTMNLALVLNAAELLGVAGQAHAMAAEYARVREQFGVPIGSFQAVQHLLADVHVALDTALSLVYYAATSLAQGLPDRALAAATAKAHVAQAGRHAVQTALQVHGGIGFTWEHDMHLYYKRALTLSCQLGDADYHLDRVADSLIAGAVESL